jgi:hypothetical protein
MLHRYAPAQPSTHKQKPVDLGIGGKLSSHHHGEWTYKKTWPARHSKKPTLVEGVHNHFCDQLYQ